VGRFPHVGKLDNFLGDLPKEVGVIGIRLANAMLMFSIPRNAGGGARHVESTRTLSGSCKLRTNRQTFFCRENSRIFSAAYIAQDQNVCSVTQFVQTQKTNLLIPKNVASLVKKFDCEHRAVQHPHTDDKQPRQKQECVH